MLEKDARYTEFKEIYSRATKKMNAGICSFDFTEGTNRITGHYNYITKSGQVYMNDSATFKVREWNINKGYSKSYKVNF